MKDILSSKKEQLNILVVKDFANKENWAWHFSKQKCINLVLNKHVKVFESSDLSYKWYANMIEKWYTFMSFVEDSFINDEIWTKYDLKDKRIRHVHNKCIFLYQSMNLSYKWYTYLLEKLYKIVSKEELESRVILEFGNKKIRTKYDSKEQIQTIEHVHDKHIQFLRSTDSTYKWYTDLLEECYTFELKEQLMPSIPKKVHNMKKV